MTNIQPESKENSLSDDSKSDTESFYEILQRLIDNGRGDTHIAFQKSCGNSNRLLVTIIVGSNRPKFFNFALLSDDRFVPINEEERIALISEEDEDLEEETC